MTPSTPRPLRSDARRNRALLLDAAREMFADHGIDVAMADIARHAGVSNGTLYNRFPTRDALIEAVFVDRLESLAALADRAAADPDPWRGFVAYMTGMCELQAGDRGFNEVAARGMKSAAAQPLRDAAGASLAELFGRAARAGALRPDAKVDDLAFVIWGISRTVEMTRGYAPDAWRRHLALLIDGFRAAEVPPLPESPSPPAH
ncbi:TetR/AcrR family transcriptional regulator [Nocardia sp. NEAU-G5]|uniref:TetR/AcrR family transcriptional regulator n=1 Tax=Nocardia albiluteola TaxID=2842303 RepID=A0ABS6B1N2_9NOCA|nr:TetR/AcrR family transcriptional regulator [Nocardia albiluteola]MBU3064202.1 TetR/AcrR family transcriptional regulator [Nocardia albiluteola]